MKNYSSEYIKKISKEYSIYSIENRGIPDITDGLKNVQRKMLWTIRNKSDKVKTISLVGAAIEDNIYVHGDAAGATAVSQMAAPFKNNVCLLKGEGNFGSRIQPEGWAAPRYTYVKKTNITEKLIYPDHNIVPMVENYDGSTMEPSSFLPLIPMVLLNGVSGIAVGWATDILPRSFKDIVKATIQSVKGKKVERFYPKFDYLSCDIVHVEGNSYEVTGKFDRVDTSTIVVTELSPFISLEKFKENLDILEEKGTISGYQDKSTKVINVVIKFPRGTVKNMTDEAIVKTLKLTQKKSENLVALDFYDGTPTQYENEVDIVNQFTKWRFKWYEVRFKKLIDDDNDELLYYKGLRTCIVKKLPEKAQKLSSKSDMIDTINTMTGNTLREGHVDRISNISIYRWTADFINEVNDKISSLEDKIKTNTDIMNDESKLKSIYISELEELLKLKI